MSNREFTAQRTMLANAFATAGAELMEYMGTAAALAAIPNTEPPRFVIAGTLAEMVKLLPAAEVIKPSAVEQPTGDLTDEQIVDRMLCADRAYYGIPVGVVIAGGRAIERSAIAAYLARQAQAEPTRVPEGFVLMPKRLTAENGAKGALSGEFKESMRVTCHECDGTGEGENDEDCVECKGEGTVDAAVTVSWDTIKDIYKAAVALLAAPVAPAGAQNDDLDMQTIRDRDYNADMADKLAEGISEHFGQWIGEHSNVNCPWQNALDILNTRPELMPCKGSAGAQNAEAIRNQAHPELTPMFLLNAALCIEGEGTPEKRAAIIEKLGRIADELHALQTGTANTQDGGE